MSTMNRNEAINLLRSAGVEEAQINEDAILIASIVGTMVIRAYVKLLAEKLVEHVTRGVEYSGETFPCNEIVTITPDWG